MPTYQLAELGVQRSVAVAEAMALGNAADALLYTLEILHPDLIQPIRAVLNSDDVTATLEADAEADAGLPVLFTAMPFGLKLADETDADARPDLSFWLDGVSALLAGELDVVAASMTPAVVNLRRYLASDLSGPTHLPPTRMQLRDIVVTEDRVTAKASFGNGSNERFPGKTFTVDEHPGLDAR